jgi:GH25 family lysozyme M1 (1,4-beta-N-acetylmuramidase)
MVASAQLLDVSNYQGNFDWPHAKNTIPNLVGGVFRLTQGLGHANSPDPYARHNHDQLQGLNLYAGAYHFMDPALDGAEQAAYFHSEYRNLGMDDLSMLWLDDETAKSGISAHQTSLVGQAFMTELHKLAPWNPQGVYSFIDFIKYGYVAGLGHYPLWLAFPAAKAPAVPPEWMKWTMWQWGMRDGTDADAYNGTVAEFDQWIRSFGPKDPTTPQMHRMTGLKTMNQVAADFQTTVPLMIRETLAHVHGELSTGQRRLINHLDDVRPEPGTEIWIP